eukprot:scaffold8581_cov109-Isochrysis_galbana.AAC.6
MACCKLSSIATVSGSAGRRIRVLVRLRGWPVPPLRPHLFLDRLSASEHSLDFALLQANHLALLALNLHAGQPLGTLTHALRLLRRLALALSPVVGGVAIFRGHRFRFSFLLDVLEGSREGKCSER